MAYLAQNLYWSDSEMWPLSVARNVFSPYSHQDFFVKPLFNSLLLVLYWIGMGLDMLPLDIARIFMNLNLALIVILIFRIVRRITQNELLSLASAVVFVTAITMVEQGTRIRSDLIACTLNLLTLDLILRKGNQKLLVWLPALLSMLVTPKAIYFLLAFYPFYPSFKSWPKKKIKKFLIIAVSIVGIVVILRYQTIYAIMKYFLLSFTREGTGLNYFDSLRFEHVIRAIQKDFLLWLLIFARLLWVRSFKGFDAMFVILVLALAFHPDRMPFFIASLLPFLFIITVSHSAFAGLFKRMQTEGKWAFTIVLGLLFAFAMQRFLVRTSFLLQEHNNSLQRQALHLIQGYVIETPFTLVYDPVGIIYKTPSPLDWYIGPGEVDNNREVMKLIRITTPDMILYTMRVRWLEPDIYRFLQENYVNLGGGVYAHYPKIVLKPKQRILSTEEILNRLPLGKTISDPDAPVRLFVFDEQQNEISGQGYWELKGGKRLTLSNFVTLNEFQTKLLRVKLPEKTAVVRVSFWKDFKYTLPVPLYSLFRFDSEL